MTDNPTPSRGKLKWAIISISLMATAPTQAQSVHAAKWITPSESQLTQAFIDLPYDASPIEYLRAAATALHDRRITEVQDALEHAETRSLDRSVPLGRVYAPSKNPVVRAIAEARNALIEADWERCEYEIALAIDQSRE